MTSHHDVAGVVAELRNFGSGDTLAFVNTSKLAIAATILEKQAKALSEVEAERDLAEHHSNHFARLYKRTDTELAAAEARLAEAMSVIEPFAVIADRECSGPISSLLNAVKVNLKVAHLRAARAFTNAAKEKT